MPRDEIRLEGLRFFGRHGVNEEETRLGQRFGVDLTVWADLDSAAGSDEVGDTISYAALYKLVRTEVEGEPSRLLEHLAGRILRAALLSDRRLLTCKVKITKLAPPIAGITAGEASVTLERGRDWASKGG
jgi:dihydroneopterin aldolase